jgi:ribokinase
VTAGRALLVDGTDLEASIAAATAARNAGVLTMVDVDRPAPGIDRLLRVIDVVVVPESFALAFTGARDVGEALQRLEQGFQPALAVATLGARGALARCADVEIRSPGFRVEVVDSTGAGDAFRGGLLAGWLTSGGEADVEDVLEYANAVAALACTGLGAQSALPREPAVRALVTGSAVARSN